MEWLNLTDEEVDRLLKDTSNRPRTQSLFIEYENENYRAVFTLQPFNVIKDGTEYLSLYRKYMEIADPTEYRFAIKCFGSYQHWQLLQSRPWFQPYVNAWREELDASIKSQAAVEMFEIANTTSSDQTRVQALKWLSDRGYLGSIPKPKRRGRPSKEEIEGELRRQLTNSKDINDDYTRLFGGEGD